jgi:2-polyprenyl-3-methyl-5-hydroxy-6-metoxy-1,4-benzoquinol methylase
MTGTSEFCCVLCGAGGEPDPVHDRVNGDREGGLSVVACPACGHVQLDPPEYSIEFYNEDGQINYVVHNYGTPLEKILEHSWIEARRRVERFAERGLGLFRAVDVGGGYGFFGSELKRALPEADVIVLEPSARRAEMGRDHLRGRGDAVGQPQFQVGLLDSDYVERNAGTFDLVTLWHVVEHVTDPVGLLANAFALLRPGGRVCVEVPNLNDELLSLSPAFRDRSFMIEHVSYFSPALLGRLAQDASGPGAAVSVSGYQRYGIFNYFHWIHFNAPQGASPDMFEGRDRWWLEASWRAAREGALTSDALFMTIQKPE